MKHLKDENNRCVADTVTHKNSCKSTCKSTCKNSHKSTVESTLQTTEKTTGKTSAKTKVNIEPCKDVISRWQEDERPRERLLRHGPENLSTAELLALCLVSGSKGEDAVRMSRRLLEEFGGVGTLLGAPISALTKFRGVGLAKAAQIKAIHELMARDVEVDLAKGQRFNDQQSVSRYLRKRIGHSPREVFACLYLNSKHELLAFEIMFNGSIDRAHVHPREVLRRGIELNAAAIILAHNHPSGVAEPSQADIFLTKELTNLLKQVDIRVINHFVVCARNTVSLAARGLI